MTTEQKQTPQWQREFPDFPAADMPDVSPSFEDKSWHNDACPSFYAEDLGLTLWIDYADREKREMPRYSYRFTLLRQDDPEEDSGREIIATDNWDEILTAIKIRWTEYCHEIGRA
jgi:hypothetical protein